MGFAHPCRTAARTHAPYYGGGTIHIYAALLQVPAVYRGEGTPLPVTVFAGSPVGSSVRYFVTRVRPSYS